MTKVIRNEDQELVCPECGYLFDDEEIDEEVPECPECGEELEWDWDELDKEGDE